MKHWAFSQIFWRELDECLMSHKYEFIHDSRGCVFNCTRFLFLRMKTSRFRHLCQRSRPSCQRGRTGAWTRPWTSSGKKPGSVCWRRSGRRPCGRTLPPKAPTASRSTCPRPRPASDESEPARRLRTPFRHSWHTHTHTHAQTDLRRITHNAQRPRHGITPSSAAATGAEISLTFV